MNVLAALRRSITRAMSPLVNIREHVALLDERLDRLSVGRRLVASLRIEPQSVEFAVYKPGSSKRRLGDAADQPHRNRS